MAHSYLWTNSPPSRRHRVSLLCNVLSCSDHTWREIDHFGDSFGRVDSLSHCLQMASAYRKGGLAALAIWQNLRRVRLFKSLIMISLHGVQSIPAKWDAICSGLAVDLAIDSE